MKIKLIIAFIVVFSLGFYFGATYLRLQEYARGGVHSLQGQELLGEINEYESHYGEYPNQDWFKDLGGKRITTESRVWTYHNPPLKSPSGKIIMISVPIDRGRLYLYGYAEGYVQSGSYDILINSEQVEASDS